MINYQQQQKIRYKMQIKKITGKIVKANSSSLEYLDVGKWGVWAGSSLVLVTSSKERAQSLIQKSSKF